MQTGCLPGQGDVLQLEVWKPSSPRSLIWQALAPLPLHLLISSVALAPRLFILLYRSSRGDQARLLHVAHLQVGGRVAQALAADRAAALPRAQRARAGVVAEAVEGEAGAVLQLPRAARQRRAVGLPHLRKRACAVSYLLSRQAQVLLCSGLPLLRARAPAPSATYLVYPALACLVSAQVPLSAWPARCQRRCPCLVGLPLFRARASAVNQRTQRLACLF